MNNNSGEEEMMSSNHSNKNENYYYSRERIFMQMANFIRHEMPIWLVQRIRDLDCVPMMKDMPSVQEDLHKPWTGCIRTIPMS